METRAIIGRMGGPSKVARIVGYKSHTAVLRWVRIPDRFLLKLEAATGIPREELRPDLFARAPTLTSTSPTPEHAT